MTGVKSIIKFLKQKAAPLCLSAVLAGALLAGCGNEPLSDAFDTVETSAKYGIGSSEAVDIVKPYSDGLVVTSGDAVENSSIDTSQSEASLLFDIDTRDILLSHNIMQQVYPASTTKIMTALVVLENVDNLDDTLTVSSNAVNLPSGSSVAYLQEGDVVTVRDALYGLLLNSGNDAAIALAEYVSGSVDSFVQLMNQEAQSLGATHTHYVNSSGLHDDNHYTTAYDTYLIFNAAIQNDTFLQIASTPTYTATYTHADGSAASEEYVTTDEFLDGTYDAPTGITLLAGKTGTTTEAGCCLVLLSKGADGNRYISVVMDSPSKEELYPFMSTILSLEK